ncbi:MAG TPA: ABC transporter ATP-binding protein [Syntrophobacteria bacterium]|nr:ABC transporter ATP-binding protein [Syntrophobacteria bacterium]
MVKIELDSITFRYGDRRRAPLFAELSLTIAAGEWVGLVGPSGAGKTTLLKVMKGLLRPEAGEVRVNGAPLHELNSLAAFVFANPENQIVSPVVGEDVGFALEQAGLDLDTIRRRAEQALRRVGLWERARDLSHNLSGGEQQRLILAGALALRARCLLLDDPLSMVDGHARRDLLALLAEIREEEGCSLVQTTHLLDEVVNVSRVVALERGRVVFDGPPATFFREASLIDALGLEVPPLVRLGEELKRANLMAGREIMSSRQLLGLLGVAEGRRAD